MSRVISGEWRIENDKAPISEKPGLIVLTFELREKVYGYNPIIYICCILFFDFESFTLLCVSLKHSIEIQRF